MGKTGADVGGASYLADVCRGGGIVRWELRGMVVLQLPREISGVPLGRQSGDTPMLLGNIAYVAALQNRRPIRSLSHGGLHRVRRTSRHLRGEYQITAAGPSSTSFCGETANVAGSLPRTPRIRGVRHGTKQKSGARPRRHGTRGSVHDHDLSAS